MKFTKMKYPNFMNSDAFARWENNLIVGEIYSSSHIFLHQLALSLSARGVHNTLGDLFLPRRVPKGWARRCSDSPKITRLFDDACPKHFMKLNTNAAFIVTINTKKSIFVQVTTAGKNVLITGCDSKLGAALAKRLDELVRSIDSPAETKLTCFFVGSELYGVRRVSARRLRNRPKAQKWIIRQASRHPPGRHVRGGRAGGRQLRQKPLTSLASRWKKNLCT